MDEIGMGRLNVKRREDSGRKENAKKKQERGHSNDRHEGENFPQSKCKQVLSAPVGLNGMISFTLFH